MATLLRTDGSEQEVQPANGKSFTLAEMQSLVDGFIEILDVGEGVMVLNEEAKIHDLPFNARATAIARPFLFWFDSGICGDVLVCKHSEAGYQVEAA